VGNPWTFPLIWVLIYAVGSQILGRDPTEADVTALSYDFLLNSPGEVLVSMLVGGLAMGSVFGLASFALIYLFADRIRRYLLSVKHQRLRKMVLKRASHGS